MNYFQAYSLSPDQTIVAAWDSQVAEAAETPWLAEALSSRSADLFPRFAACYAQLRALPRSARRALQRQLARSRDLTALPPTWQQKLATTLAGAALLLALAQGAQAATIKVTTNIPDINDGDEKCSLSEAIVNANNDAATHPDCAAGSGPMVPAVTSARLSDRAIVSLIRNFPALVCCLDNVATTRNNVAT